MKRNELVKALKEVDFSDEEIEQSIQKAMADGLLEADKPEKEEEDDDKDKPEDEEEDDMKKAYNEVMSAKSSFDKAMESFMDRFGNVTGFEKPKEFVKKSEEVEIEKSMTDDITKSDDFKNGLIKGITDQIGLGLAEKFESIQKSITSIQDEVEAIAKAPNPLKGIFGNYQKDVIHKSVDSEGKQTISLSDKTGSLNAFELAKSKATDDKDKEIIKSMICDFNVANKVNADGLNIVKSILNIDFEK